MTLKCVLWSKYLLESLNVLDEITFPEDTENAEVICTITRCVARSKKCLTAQQSGHIANIRYVFGLWFALNPAQRASSRINSLCGEGGVCFQWRHPSADHGGKCQQKKWRCVWLLQPPVPGGHKSSAPLGHHCHKKAKNKCWYMIFRQV